MKKFAKGMLITAACFLGIGIILGCIGAAGGSYMYQKTGNTEDFNLMKDAWHIVRGWDLRWRRGNNSGLTLTYDNIQFDKNHDIVYGSFTDDGLQSEGVRNLKLEMGGGTLVMRTGKNMEFKKEGGPACQYYIEGDTFYLKQKTPVAGGVSDLTLTLPEDMDFGEIEVEMGAGQVVTKDLITAERLEIEINAGDLTMGEVKAGYFRAESAAGSVEVKRLDAQDCSIEVNMGSILLQDSLIAGDLDAEVNMGDIDIYLRDSYEDHDYELDCGMGDITINAEDGKIKEFAGFSNEMELFGQNASGGSVYDLTCSMGSILVQFSGKERSGADTADAMDTDIEADPEAGEETLTEENWETEESPLTEETKETEGGLPGLEDIYGVEDNWPESIGRVNEDMTAEAFSFDIWISEPADLSISCVTESGKMGMKIEDEKGKKIFEKKNVQTGSYEADADKAGVYTVRIDCENHTGSFWIMPED